MAYRANATELANYESVERIERVSYRIEVAGAVAVLWIMALVGPWAPPWKPASIDWMFLLPAGLWLFCVVNAVRKYQSTGRRILVYIVVVPAALCLLSWLVKIAT